MTAGGEILMSGSIREAYEHGKGPITVRGKAFIEGIEESEDGSSEASSSAESKPKQTRKKVCLPRTTPAGWFCCVGEQDYSTRLPLRRSVTPAFSWQQCAMLQRAHIPLQPFLDTDFCLGEPMAWSGV